jgi:soluble lytic murein transglycosylase
MQLIGPTAQEVATELGLRGISIPEDVFVPENNIQMGTYYIAKMIKQFNGHVPLGLAAYNAGPHRLKSFIDGRKEVSAQMQKFSSDPLDEMWFDELPWYETSFYVKAILRNAIMYQLLDKSTAKEPDQRRVQFGSVLWGNLVVTSAPSP